MSDHRILLSLPTLAFLVCLATPLVAEEALAGSEASIADFDWLVGDWLGEKNGGLVEERWSAAAGGAMMGMFRWLADGKVRLYEFLLIEPGPQGPVMRLKHFSPGLVGWEEKEESLEFHLESTGDGRAVFAMDPEIEDTRLVYESQDAGSGLSVRLIKKKADGQESVTAFEYSRH